jgi:hypothetical protein
MVKWLVTAGVLAISLDAAAQTRFTMVDPPAETIRDEADVSARAVVIGAVRPWREPAAPRPPLDAITADIPAEWRRDPVCLALVTQDGLYEYRSTLQAPADWDGATPVALEFEPSIALLERYAAGEVALLTGRGDCDAEPAALAPASLGLAAAGRAETVELLINSFRADEVYLIVGHAPDFAVQECRPLAQGSRVAFDHRCPIPVGSFDGPTPVQIMRLRNQSPDPRIEILLDMP